MNLKLKRLGATPGVDIKENSPFKAFSDLFIHVPSF